MSSAGHYDQNLLASAPQATKAELQEGYNVDILQHQQQREGRGTPPTRQGTGDLETGAAPVPLRAKERSAPGPNPKSAPFYSTRKGALGLFALVLVVIAIVVGVSVGVTQRNKHHSSSAAPLPGSSSSSASSSGSGNATAGAGADSTASSAPQSGGAQASGGAFLAVPTPTPGSAAVAADS